MYLILREASFCRGWWLIQAHNGSTCWKLVTMACPIINGTFTSNLLPWTLGKHHGRRQSIGDIQRLWKAAAKYYLLVMMQLLRSWTPWWLWLPTKDLHKIEPLKTPSWTGGRGMDSILWHKPQIQPESAVLPQSCLYCTIGHILPGLSVL